VWHAHRVTQQGSGGTTEQLLPPLHQATVFFTNAMQSPVTPSDTDFTVSFKSEESKTWKQNSPKIFQCLTVSVKEF